MERLIAVDWGTTSLRAWLVDGEGRTLKQAASGDGVLNVRDGAFAAALERLVGEWPRAPILAAGMVGSRQGWVEAPYAECPAGAADLARRTARLKAPGLGAIAIVPGVSRIGADGVPDVMRGEETQVLGAARDGLFVLPGTHSKWVTVEAGRIVRFATYMTGEVFAVLSAHSILGRLMSGDSGDEAAFASGVERGAASGRQLLHALFSARSLGLFGLLPQAGVRSYLSGLLIGAEIAGAGEAAARGRIGVIGAPTLAASYGRALALLGWEAEELGEATTISGLLRVAAAS